MHGSQLDSTPELAVLLEAATPAAQIQSVSKDFDASQLQGNLCFIAVSRARALCKTIVCLNFPALKEECKSSPPLEVCGYHQCIHQI